jgi:NADH:ubiquinone reductase (H+-translocating)
VIVGAGFAGLTLARSLGKAPVQVQLVDRNNYHLFTPLLYQVASALLDPAEIAHPVRQLIRPLRNCSFLQSTVLDLDFDGRRIETEQGSLEYDYLVLAMGSTPNFFGNRSLEERGFGLKELPDGLALRNRILDRFERSRWEPSAEIRKAMLSFVVIGGGPTGVELAGALVELISLVLHKDYPDLDPHEPKVILMEAADRLLGPFDPSLSEAAKQALEKKGVEVHLKAMVKEALPGQLEMGDGSFITAGTVIWTAGVRAADLTTRTGQRLARQSRVPVTPTLHLEDRPEVFAIGDAADANGLPMLIPVAMQQAKYVARAIQAREQNRELEPFSYRDPGIMATVGRNVAVAQLGPLRMKGIFGWLTWLAVHLVNVVTFRAKLIVLLHWSFEYLFFDRPIRLLLRAGRGPGRGADD